MCCTFAWRRHRLPSSHMGNGHKGLAWSVSPLLILYRFLQAELATCIHHSVVLWQMPYSALYETFEAMCRPLFPSYHVLSPLEMMSLITGKMPKLPTGLELFLAHRRTIDTWAYTLIFAYQASLLKRCIFLKKNLDFQIHLWNLPNLSHVLA